MSPLKGYHAFSHVICPYFLHFPLCSILELLCEGFSLLTSAILENGKLAYHKYKPLCLHMDMYDDAKEEQLSVSGYVKHITRLSVSLLVSNFKSKSHLI